jgi:carboxypeptidase C (cathepsin A)
MQFLALALGCLAPACVPAAPLALQDDKPAEAKPQGDASKEDPKAKSDAPAEESPNVTEHRLVLAGGALDYRATAGRLPLKDEDGKRKADVFYVAYEKLGVQDLAARPLIFAFNGGPGSSSVWLHLGTIGPRRVEMSADGLSAKPPYRLVDNQETWLEFADLVFVDPVTTGYSRAATGEDDGQFHGVQEDVRSVAEFIRLYTTRAKRWLSPKYLAGESYGTTRAAGLAGELQGRHGMYLNGILLISAILNFGTAEFDRGNDLPYALHLPTYTATAWFHKQLAPDLQRDLRATLDEVEAFARGEYTVALMRGDKLPPADRAKVRAKLARYTGLSEEYVASTNERIEISRFTKELLRSDRRTVGRLDSRFTGRDYDAAGEGYEGDPSYAGIQGPFTAVLNDYVRRELGFESDLPYEILTGRVHPWKFGQATNRYLNVAETLRRAMMQNPHLQVFVASGYYDLATPYFATDYTLDHLGLEPEFHSHVHTSYFESGHMMYIHDASRVQLTRDVQAFVAATD